jgi:hypothetical protein
MPEKPQGNARTPRVVRTIQVEDDVLKRSVDDVISDPIPFPRFDGKGSYEAADADPQEASSIRVESSVTHAIEKLQQDVFRLQKAVAATRTINIEQQEINTRDQQEINDGQRRINGQLCRVDWMLLETLRLLRIEIEKLPGIGKADLQRIDEVLTRAYHTSAAVSELPPGCEPAVVEDPDWSINDTVDYDTVA